MPKKPFCLVAITMSDINKLFKRLTSDYAYTFILDDAFSWSASSDEIKHPNITDPEHIWSLLHEISHAELGHSDFDTDVALLVMEAAAWQHAATQVAPLYDVRISPDYIEDHLDTYRRWLHERSRCPRCSQNGMQTKTKIYSCLHCRFLWRTNEARLCELRRLKLQPERRSLV